MARRFVQFQRLPVETQQRIWELSMLNPSPCVQALGLYVVPHRQDIPQQTWEAGLAQDWSEELVNTIDANVDRLRFVLPEDPVLSMCSPYSHTIEAAALTCEEAFDTLKRVIVARQRAESDEEAGIRASLDGASLDAEEEPAAWKIDVRKTISIINAVPEWLDEPEKGGALCPDIIMAYRRPLGLFPVFLNPTIDLLWLDCPFDEYNSCDLVGVSRRRLSAGIYNKHLVAVQNLAVEFSHPKFKRTCLRCDRLERNRQKWDRFRADWQSLNRRAHYCLLCMTMEMAVIVSLPEDEQRELRDLLRLSIVRTTVNDIRAEVSTVAAVLAGHYPDPYELWLAGETLDRPAFARHYSMLAVMMERMNQLARDLRGAYPNGPPGGLEAACLESFDGDLLRYYNSIQYAADPLENTYFPARYHNDGSPICLAGNPQIDHEDYGSHTREWCGNSDAIAGFWPATTPSLRNLFVIDREIKLKPGASIPEDSRTFQGNNGCVLVEVPEPVHHPLEDGGEDDVWQYPLARPWDATAFGFARYLRQRMQERQEARRRGGTPWVGINADDDITQFVQHDPDSVQNRAIMEAAVPACVVLAIVEQ